MGISIIAKNATQQGQTLLRGGRLTAVDNASAIEAPIDQGGLLGYDVPQFKNAIIKGAFVITSLGTDNTFMQVELFDSQSGRLIPIARTSSLLESKEFELKVTQLRARPANPQDQNVQFHGDGTTNDGTAEWYASILELPN